MRAEEAPFAGKEEATRRRERIWELNVNKV